MERFRLLQIVMFAAACLLLLKSSALIFSDVSVLTGAKGVNAQEALVAKADETAADKAAAKDEADKKSAAENGVKVAAKDGKAADKEMAGPMPEGQAKKAGADDQKSSRDPDGIRPSNYNEYKLVPSGSELDLLESLAVRRKQLNERESQLKLRENLLTAAQKQIDERIQKLKDLESKIQVDLKKQDELRENQYARLVKMYSSMKPKEAARIFDGLDMTVLVDLLRAMKATSGSQIVAKMNAEKARAVTMMLAKKEQLKALPKKQQVSDLPAIEGDKPAAENQ